MPVIVLTTVGQVRQAAQGIALMRVEHGGEYAAVASLGGSRNHRSGTTTSSPTRTSSCRTARPGATTPRARSPAREGALVGTSRGGYPDYAAYQRRTEREIPLFVLTPMPA
jgi:deazaflavin-dependent oxidoreductase (nitroreductase family)